MKPITNFCLALERWDSFDSFRFRLEIRDVLETTVGGQVGNTRLGNPHVPFILNSVTELTVSVILLTVFVVIWLLLDDLKLLEGYCSSHLIYR